VRGGAQEEAQQPELIEKGLPEAQPQVHDMHIQHRQLPLVRTSMPALASLGQVCPCPNPSQMSSLASPCIPGACGRGHLSLHSQYSAGSFFILYVQGTCLHKPLQDIMRETEASRAAQA